VARDDPRCLPSTRTLRRIRWPLQPRSRDRLTAFRVGRRPLNDALTSSWVLAGPAPFIRRSPTVRASLRSTWSTAALAPMIRPELGPRSLVPSPFLERCVRAYWRPDTACRFPATFTATYGQPDPDSRFPHGDEGLDLLPFLTHHARPLLAKSGDTRWAAQFVRPIQSRCRFLLLSQICPTAIPKWPRHLRLLRERSVVAIDVHGSLDRAKDVSSSNVERAFSRLRSRVRAPCER